MTNEYLDFLLSGGDLWPDFSRVLRRHRQERPQVPGRPPRHQRPGHLQVELSTNIREVSQCLKALSQLRHYAKLMGA